MGQVQTIIEENDILTDTGFKKASKRVRLVNEGELQFLLAFPEHGQSREFKLQQALARFELERRSTAEARKVAWISAGAGLMGVIVGAVLQWLVTK